jgi:hypothetical protein
MSSAQALSLVKQALLEQLHHEIVPQFLCLVQGLPEQLVDFAQEEAHLRAGLLQVGQQLLNIWGHRADVKVAHPGCPSCGVPMRHRGLPQTGVVITLGLGGPGSATPGVFHSPAPLS